MTVQSIVRYAFYITLPEQDNGLKPIFYCGLKTKSFRLGYHSNRTRRAKLYELRSVGTERLIPDIIQALGHLHAFCFSPFYLLSPKNPWNSWI